MRGPGRLLRGSQIQLSANVLPVNLFRQAGIQRIDFIMNTSLKPGALAGAGRAFCYVKPTIFAIRYLSP
jgi:hypothetical protein